MEQATSKSREIIKTLDRETLEAAFFVAVAFIRHIAKGDVPPPPKTADRTTITVTMIRTAQDLTGKVEDQEAEVTDVHMAAEILKQIANGGQA